MTGRATIGYSVVPKNTMPKKTRMPPGKWIEILNELGMNKSLEFKFKDTKRADLVRQSILGCFRWARLKRHNFHYKVKSRLIRNADKTCTLYIWKESLEAK